MCLNRVQKGSDAKELGEDQVDDKGSNRLE